MSPAPTRAGENGSDLAAACNLSQSAIPRSEGELSAHRAAQPATCAAAELVPLMILYCGQTEDKISRPGAAISILPKLENDEGASAGSSDATDMMVGEFAGALTPPLPGELPAPESIRQPRLRAAAPAAV